ncbi:Acyl-CoA N-acyltransferase protein [Raphanus sativus]|nr:Acyl-CoA N-acyltransferase protein [Raphanus sativus]
MVKRRRSRLFSLLLRRLLPQLPKAPNRNPPLFSGLLPLFQEINSHRHPLHLFSHPRSRRYVHSAQKTRQRVCKASQIADLFPAVSPEIVVREARVPEGLFSRYDRRYVAGILTVDTVTDYLPRKGPLCQRRTGIAYISNVAVRESFRRKEIAKRLVWKAEALPQSGLLLTLWVGAEDLHWSELLYAGGKNGNVIDSTKLCC